MIVEKLVNEIGFDQVCFVMEDNLDSEIKICNLKHTHSPHPESTSTVHSSEILPYS